MSEKKTPSEAPSSEEAFVKNERFNSPSFVSEEDPGVNVKASHPSTNLAAEVQKSQGSSKIGNGHLSSMETSRLEELTDERLPFNNYPSTSKHSTSLPELSNLTGDKYLSDWSSSESETVTLFRKADLSYTTLKFLEEGYRTLVGSSSNSLLRKYLTQDCFDKLKRRVTLSFGSTLLDCIQSGLLNLDSSIGLYAPDAESYTTFSELFDPIIEEYHFGFKNTDLHGAPVYGNPEVFGDLDPDGEFVISTRIRCSRSLKGFPFNPCLSKIHYLLIEKKLKEALLVLDEGELAGTYYPLETLEENVQQQLIDDHLLFKKGDRYLRAAKALRYWPSGRGIFLNAKRNFIIWCNEEDHLRIISMENGSNVGAVYKRLLKALKKLEERLSFIHDERLGFLTFCPTNLGTTIRASVHIKLPRLSTDSEKLQEIATKYKLQVRGFKGEHSEAENGIYDISNRRRLGLTEFEAIQEMYSGISELIALEKAS